jgi:outer membrane protein assembly factor BamB
VRWWPLIGIGLLLALLLLWIWYFVGEQRQTRVLATISAVGSAFILALIWLVFLSRLRWKIRLTVLGLLAALLGLAFGTLERRGVTGDVLPLLQWRWTSIPADLVIPGTGHTDRLLAPGPPDDGVAYPQFQGPRRDGTVEGVRLATDWQSRPPKQLWRRPIGEGWSGFAVAGAYAVTQEQRGPNELVSCYDRQTGEPIWVHATPVRHEDPLGGPGPRATPTIDGSRVYALGGTGILNVLDLQTGEPLWSTDVMRDNDARPPTYGVSASPLVLGDLVIVVAGGREGRSLVAYDRQTGEPIWSGGDHPAAYSSPILARLAGGEQIVVLNGSHFVGHDAGDGAVLWQYRWPGGTENVSQPVVLGDDRLFLSTGYGVGGKLFRIAKDADGAGVVEVIWESRGLKAKFTNVVHRDGYLYGLDDGRLACLDVAGGERVWKGGRYGHGQVVLVGDILLIQGEGGEVVLVEATPDEHRRLARLEALHGKTWNHPALAGRHLLVRNDREAACFELAVE